MGWFKHSALKHTAVSDAGILMTIGFHVKRHIKIKYVLLSLSYSPYLIAESLDEYIFIIVRYFYFCWISKL